MRRASAIGRWLAARPAPEGLAVGPEFEDSWILEVKAQQPRLYLSAWLGFHPREYEGERTWRWMGQAGALAFVTIRESTEGLRDLALELKAFPRARQVQWLLNGRRLGEVEVGTEWRRYELPLGPLAPGKNTLTLACRGPAVVASDVLHNGDPRAVGLAVGTWSIDTVAPGRSGTH